MSKKIDVKALAAKIAASLDKHKAMDIEVVDVHDQTSLADYFVIASGGSNTQAKSLCDYVEKEIKDEDGIMSARVEGYSTGTWILVDYGSVILHIFTLESRKFYDLERLWLDSPHVDVKADFEK